MTDTQQSQPSQPPIWEPLPQPAQRSQWPAPELAPHGRGPLIVSLVCITTLLVALAAMIITAVHQSGEAEDARSHAADVTEQRDAVKAELADAQATLADTEASLTSVRADLTSTEDQVSTCQLLTTISQHLLLGFSASNEGSLATSNGNYFRALDQTNKANDELSKAVAVLDDNGYDTLWDLTEACDPTGQNS